jgi:hypothetical protein
MLWVAVHPGLEAHPILHLLLTIISVAASAREVSRVDPAYHQHHHLWLICNRDSFQNKHRVKFITKKNYYEKKLLLQSRYVKIHHHPKTKKQTTP